ncbi:unnamed protein product [Amoebophrya sp. A25]|nr:unnamed protein product [Amoebophrya sp. A25]|eukprot:GSA25T00018086001.1
MINVIIPTDIDSDSSSSYSHIVLLGGFGFHSSSTG